MSTYMKINTIKGGVTTKGYEGCIDVQGVTHQGQRDVYQRVGHSTREMSVAQLQHLVLQKAVDASSADLWQHFLSGKVIPEISLTRCHLNNGSAEWQSKITLTNVTVSNIHENTNAVGAQETVDLAYSKIERGYRNQSSSGQWQTPKHTSFNLETAEVG